MPSPSRLRRARAGAVVYPPGAPIEDLFAAFTGMLKQRGWRLGGLIQRTDRDPRGRKIGMVLIDLANGCATDIGQALGKLAGGDACTVDPAAVADTTATVRRAMAEGVDLLVVNKFSQLERQRGGFSHEMLTAMAEGVPLLTAVPAVALEDWLRFCGGHCDLLAPSIEALWRWWGPHRLYRELALGVGEGEAKRVVVGLNWTMVEGPDGIGLATTPPRDTPGCYGRLDAGRYAGRSLAELAALADSWNPFETAIGLAATGAWHNRYDLAAEPLNGLDALGETHGRVVVIGSFPGIAERLPGCQVVERYPEEGEFPDWAAEWLLPGCEAAVVTGSALANRSLPRLLELATDARVALVGPSTPLAPGLFDYGLTALSGLVATDPDGLARTVAEGGATRALKNHGRQVTLRRPE